MTPGEPVPLGIEILPSGTLFRPGETLRLVTQGKDIYHYPRPVIQALHDDRVNHGAHVIHVGGGYDSHLLVPVQLRSVQHRSASDHRRSANKKVRAMTR